MNGTLAGAQAEPFRETELGSLPVSWGLAPIGDLFNVQQGKALSPSVRQGVAPRPFLRTSNVLWGRLDLRNLDQMDFTEEEVERLSLNASDLLVCEGGEVGRTAIWRGDRPDCLYQNHLHRLRAKKSGLVPEFVMYWMQAALLQLGLYGGAANRTTIPNLSGARLKQLPIPLPPVEEQRNIAEVLATIQRAAEVQEQIIDSLQMLKAATMAKLFREGLRGEALKQTEIGEIPESWDVVPLHALLRVAQYGLSVRGERTGRYPILRMNCQEDGRVLFRDLQFVDLDEETFDTFKLRDGDLLFNRTNSFELVGGTAIFHGDREAVFASYLIRLRPDEEALVPDFLNYYFNPDWIQAGLKSLATRGVSQSNISASKLKSFKVCVPSREEQRQVVVILDRVSEMLTASIERRDRIRGLFSAVLRPGDARRAIEMGDRFVGGIVEKGRVLYARPPAETRPPGPAHPVQRGILDAERGRPRANGSGSAQVDLRGGRSRLLGRDLSRCKGLRLGSRGHSALPRDVAAQIRERDTRQTLGQAVAHRRGTCCRRWRDLRSPHSAGDQRGARKTPRSG